MTKVAIALSLFLGGTSPMFFLLANRTIENQGGFLLSLSGDALPPITDTDVIKFRMPFPFRIATVRASLTAAQSSGNIITVDINESGSSILSTKLTIDNTETTSTTAATPVVVSDSYLAEDAEISIDIDQVGSTTSARGLKVYIGGERAP